MIRTALIVLSLAGCAEQAAAPAAPPPPVPHCDRAIKAPPPPRKPRTLEAIARWSVQIELAGEANGRALRECSGHVEELNDWIAERLEPVGPEP